MEIEDSAIREEEEVEVAEEVEATMIEETIIIREDSIRERIEVAMMEVDTREEGKRGMTEMSEDHKERIDERIESKTDNIEKTIEITDGVDLTATALQTDNTTTKDQETTIVTSQESIVKVN